MEHGLHAAQFLDDAEVALHGVDVSAAVAPDGRLALVGGHDGVGVDGSRAARDVGRDRLAKGGAVWVLAVVDVDTLDMGWNAGRCWESRSPGRFVDGAAAFAALAAISARSAGHERSKARLKTRSFRTGGGVGEQA